MALTKVTGQVIKSDTNITSHNINSSGIITAVSFSGPLDTTGGNFTGIITATSATFSGNVTIGGTLTYEDVTNIDSLGIVTARNGLRVTAGGINVTAGVSTYSALVDVNNRLDVVGGANVDQVNVTGVSTFSDDVRIVKTAGPLLELTTNTGAADATLRLSEGATGSTTNGGGMFYSGADNRLYITCGTDSTTKRISINRDDGHIGIGSDAPSIELDILNTSSSADLRLKTTANSFNSFIMDSNRAADTQFAIIDGRWNGNVVNRIQFVTGSDGTNKDDGYMAFHTRTSGASLAEALRIENTGEVWVKGGTLKLGTTNGTDSIIHTTNAAGILYRADENGHRFQTYVSGWKDRLTIKDDGKVDVGGNESGYKFNIIDESNRTTTAETALLLYAKHDGSGTTGTGFGTGIRFWGDRASGNVEQNMGRIMCTAEVNSGTTLSGALSFETSVAGALSERLRITSAGKIGINTDNPSAALTVSSPSAGLGDSTINAGWLDQYDDEGIRLFHNATARIGVYTSEQGDWSSGIVLGTIDGSTTRKWGIGMASNAKSAYNNGLYFGYLSSTNNNDANTFNAMRKDIIIASNGNVNIETGDLIMGTNNKGISFANSSSSPDSTATSSTRIMTDYDEGTCPWELHRSDGLTTGSNSGDTRVSYTKIGNRVFMSGYVYTQSTGSSTGVVARLTNASGGAAELPYTAAHDGVMAISKTRTLDDGYRHLAVGFAKDGKQVYVYGDDGNNAYTPEHNNVNISSNQTHLVIAFSGSYETTE